MMEWIPSEEEYNPGVTKEQWIEFVQDNNIFNENSLITFACIQKAKVATCADMAEDFGRNANFYNSNVWRTGERIYKKINCPLWQRENGTDRFWSVCCFGRDLKNGRFEFKVRPELQEAFEETGILEGVEVMEKKTSFTWIPFYTEMAEKLLKYKDNRKELVKIVYGMNREYVNYIKDENGDDYPDIDPFSVFAIFNRTSTEERRKEICRYFKSVFQLESDVPKDFDSIPLMNPQLSVFVWRGDISSGIQPIWDLYVTVFENNFDNEKFSNHFNIVRNQKGIKWTLTMALYWIRPYEFMPLDAPSREYLNKIGIEVFDEKDLNGQNYLDLCKIIKDKIANNETKEKSIPDISSNAWIKDNNTNGLEINFWSGGIYWGEEKKLEDFSTNNYWQIGWEKTLDNKSAIEAWKNIRKIQIGDLLSFHGYGGKNDLTIYQISKVIDKDEDNGKLLIEKLNNDDDILFHDKAPKMGKGGWFGTLFQVTGEEAINKIFGNYIQGNSQMSQQNTKLDEIKKNLLANKNIILTGAPGTGKTFMAKQIAKELGREDDNIGFVQFHPSYDYTDFVEGLRPTDKDGNGNVGFERRDGVFKEFCARALKNFVDSRKTEEEVADEKSLKDKLNEYFENMRDENKPIRLLNGNDFFITDFDENKLNISNPNNEKTSELQVSINDIFLLLSNNVELKNVRDIKKYFGRTWATQQDSYAFVLCKEIEKIQTTKTEITEKIPLKNFVFIIDEINRGEVAKIFGELFYSVDPGYRVTYDDLDAIKNGNKTVTTIKTQYANLENEGNIFDRVLQKKEKDFGHFFIPENVYIIGTMNDIDRSVESMDFAFRRRFTWAEVKASDTVDMFYPSTTENGEPTGLESKELADEAKRRMENLNSAISEIEGLNEAYHIGASYFLKLKNYDGDFGKLWEYHIKGILQEYLRGNPNGKLEDLKAAYDKREE